MKIQNIDVVRKNLSECDSDDIAGGFSDFYKDIHGFRPRHVVLNTESVSFNRFILIEEYVALVEYVNSLLLDRSGRDHLRSEGWCVDYEICDRLDYQGRAYEVSVVHSEFNNGEFETIAYTLCPIARIDIPTIVVKASEIRRYEREMSARQRAAEFGMTYEEYIG